MNKPGHFSIDQVVTYLLFKKADRSKNLALADRFGQATGFAFSASEAPSAEQIVGGTMNLQRLWQVSWNPVDATRKRLHSDVISRVVISGNSQH